MTVHPFHTFKFILIVATMITAMSCSSTRYANIERAAEYNYTDYEYREGHPEVRMSAMGFLNEEDEGIISIAADIENRSLIFRKQGDVYAADIEMVITIVGTAGHTYSDTFTAEKSLEIEDYSYTTNVDVERYKKDMEVPPGRYKVFFSVRDKASGNETVRDVDTYIPDPGDNIVNLTSVQLLGKDSDQPERGYEPVTTYDVSMNKDSLRFVIQVTKNGSEDPLVVRSRLIRFDADTSAARSASHPKYSVGSLPYQGIDYSSETEMEQTRRELAQDGSVMIEFPFKRPEKGSYRFEVTAEGADSEEELFRARDFSIKGENFPRVKSSRELAEPLIYLMGQDEHEELMSIEDPVELKEAIDRFWLSNIGSVTMAKQVIALYYERVEEANKQFTNFKEGWKTDRGMIYILFGPPDRVENRIHTERWFGSHYSRDTRYHFLFERSRIRNNYFPFDNYLLHRTQGYHNYQYQQLQLWRTGQILFASI